MRIKAKEIVEFIQDDDRLREERKKAKKNRDKYVGIDSEFASSHRISSSNSGGFGDFPKSKSTFNELDDKEWRTSNPSIQERITDITSKVKTILEKSPEPAKENNIEFSDDEREDTFQEKPSTKPNIFSDELPSKKFPDLNVILFNFLVFIFN